MKETIRRLISGLIAISLVIVMPVSVSANSEVSSENDENIKTEIVEAIDTKLTKDEERTVIEEVSTLEAIGVLCEAEIISVDVEKSAAAEDISVEYTLDYNGYENVITDVEQSYDEISYHAEQGDVSNDVVIKNDGTITVDGKEVLISEYKEEEFGKRGKVRANAENSWYSSSCPYGTASSYSKLYASGQCKDIQLRAAIRDIAMSVFLTIVFGAAGKLASFCATAAYNYIVNKAPLTSGISYKVKKYQRPEGSYVTAKKMTILKCCYTWYSNINFWGYAKYNTAYYCRQYY